LVVGLCCSWPVGAMASGAGHFSSECRNKPCLVEPTRPKPEHGWL